MEIYIGAFKQLARATKKIKRSEKENIDVIFRTKYTRKEGTQRRRGWRGGFPSQTTVKTNASPLTLILARFE